METLRATFLRMTACFLLILILLTSGAIGVGHLSRPAVIAFVSERSGTAQVYLGDVDHLITMPVSRSGVQNSDPAWSRQGDLAFVRADADGRDVVVMNMLTRQRCAISGRRLDESSPAWSGRGELAYVVGSAGRYDLYVQDGCQGNTARNVTRQSSHSVSRPNWSGAGWLVYDDDVSGTNRIAAINPETLAPIRIRQPDGLNYDGVWFQDRWLAFVSISDQNPDVYVYDLSSDELRNVSSHPASDTQPAWSPDGRLAFVSEREGRGDIFVYDFATGGLTNVTGSPAADMMPAWSPDGRLIYASSSGTVYDIFLIDQVPGGEPRLILSSPAQDYSPVWMP